MEFQVKIFFALVCIREQPSVQHFGLQNITKKASENNQLFKLPTILFETEWDGCPQVCKKMLIMSVFMKLCSSCSQND